ncbi:MAG: phosphate ABC transporter permease subunit PstC [Bdellovibrionales bacterium]|nr:phosphate ABC transporter permease subunit PstC [Bdellovibrionales bacterium]
MFQNRKRVKEINQQDRVFRGLLRGLAYVVFFLLGAMVLNLVQNSLPTFSSQGFRFFLNSEWNPVLHDYGALSFIFGTMMTSIGALALAVPVSFGVALFLSELAPAWLARPLGFMVDMLAAVPSVIFGLWGIFVICPWLQETVEPWLAENFGFLPLFQGPAYGVGILAASLILAIMIIPTVSAMSREVFKSIPLNNREAALALGATRWEMIKIGVLKSSFSGLIGAVMLGFGRALGETMAVTMVIGNRADIGLSLFAPAQTMASVIANEYGEAMEPLHLSALTAVGLSLLLVSMVINGFARWVVYRIHKGQGVVR